MTRDEASEAQIFDATGWRKGTDGKWQYSTGERYNQSIGKIGAANLDKADGTTKRMDALKTA